MEAGVSNHLLKAMMTPYGCHSVFFYAAPVWESLPIYCSLAGILDDLQQKIIQE